MGIFDFMADRSSSKSSGNSWFGGLFGGGGDTQPAAPSTNWWDSIYNYITTPAAPGYGNDYRAQANPYVQSYGAANYYRPAYNASNDTVVNKPAAPKFQSNSYYDTQVKNSLDYHRSMYENPYMPAAQEYMGYGSPSQGFTFQQQTQQQQPNVFVNYGGGYGGYGGFGGGGYGGGGGGWGGGGYSYTPSTIGNARDWQLGLMNWRI
jgi:hypothetical protein